MVNQEDEMLGTIGALVKVRVYASADDRRANRDGTDRAATITSAGPPNVSAAWARTIDGHTQEWLLIRKPVNEGRHSWEAVTGDTGQRES